MVKQQGDTGIREGEGKRGLAEKRGDWFINTWKTTEKTEGWEYMRTYLVKTYNVTLACRYFLQVEIN